MTNKEKKDMALKLLWYEISKGNITGLEPKEMVNYVDLQNADSEEAIINAVEEYINQI